MRGFFLSLAHSMGRVSLPANQDIMLTLDYLQSILFKREQASVTPHVTPRAVNPHQIDPIIIVKPEVEGLEKPEWVLESAAGYDGIIELIQTKGLPVCVVLEHNEVGNFSMHQGGFEQTSQSIWVMEMVAADEDRRKVQVECRQRMERIISILGKHFDEDDKPLVGKWDLHDIPYGIRNAGSNYTGYEFVLHFAEDIDLSYHPIES